MKRPQRVDDSDSSGFDHRRPDAATESETRAAETDLAAAFLVEVMGEDVAAAFFARFEGVMAEVCRRAEDLAHIHRAADEPVTTLPADKVRHPGPRWEKLSLDERRRIEALAARIGQGGEHASVIVMRRRTTEASQPYDLISGEDAFLALVDVMGHAAVPVHIAPPIPPETLELFD
ncbi:hypothetical protein [Methylobacterium indicum]|uniref:hypothetical protein n=1 Tax=Methylobacterium indicum TaxID=1775910 RepID=UPI002434DFF3|nr:hypothetical protein [Methylobacterium indicum]